LSGKGKETRVNRVEKKEIIFISEDFDKSLLGSASNPKVLNED